MLYGEKPSLILLDLTPREDNRIGLMKSVLDTVGASNTFLSACGKALDMVT